MSVIQFQTRPPSQPPAPAPDDDKCPLCEGKKGVHERIWVAYAWPFNKVARRKIDCPVSNKE